MSLLSPQLDAFLAVVRQGTVQQAAKDLGLTQTGVTQRIRTLEGRLGTTLFTRSRRGMRLTTEAEALLRYCRAAMELEGEVLAQLQESGQVATIQVRVAGPSSLMRSRVIPETSGLIKKFPELLFFFDLDDSENCATKLRAGQCDLAIMPRDSVAAEMDSKLLKDERYILVGSPNWKDRSVQEIVEQEHIIDFDSRDKMTLSYLKQHKLLSAGQPVRHLVNNTDALAAMAMSEVGYTVLDEHFAKSYLESGRLVNLHPGHTFENSVALAWYPRPEMPRYFSEFTKAIK